MGDAEKKSLPDNGDSEDLTGCGGFKLHCFPDITESKFNPRRASGPEETFFQRAVPGSGSCLCGALEQMADIEEQGKQPTVEEAKQIGYQRGYCEGEQKGAAEGEKIGFRKGSQSVQPAIEALGEALNELARIRRQTCRRIESELVELAVGIARKIVGQELSASPGLVLQVVRRALDQLEAADRICIRLNPQDLNMLEEAGSNFREDLCCPDAAVFESDPSIESGGCLIETDTGNIDARLETRFQAIEEMFRTVMSGEDREG